jgi:glycosyltransferase involved in cell wall biosynthesis
MEREQGRGRLAFDRSFAGEPHVILQEPDSGGSVRPALPADPDPAREAIAKIGDLAASAGLARIHILAWRDAADVEAGGSELHAATVARLWAEAGIEVTMRTSYAQGAPPESSRSGYRVIRRAGRYLVFPRAVAAELAGHHGERDGLVEIWNGVPWLSPLWARGPRVVWLHHVHSQMWSMVLPPRLARVGEVTERRLAPPLYRRTPIVTLSESSRRELIDVLRLDPARVSVVPPGIDARFSPGARRARRPLVVAVGRLMPVKRFDALIDAVVQARQRVPDTELVIVGDGAEREHLEERVADLDASEWIRLPGRLSEADLVELYRSAWVLASASAAEGWGMTITEAAACGTPAVVTDIAGHRDAVLNHETGELCAPRDLGAALGAVLADPARRERLGAAAAARAAAFTWEATATGTLAVLAGEAIRRRGR